MTYKFRTKYVKVIKAHDFASEVSLVTKNEKHFNTHDKQPLFIPKGYKEGELLEAIDFIFTLLFTIKLGDRLMFYMLSKDDLTFCCPRRAVIKHSD